MSVVCRHGGPRQGPATFLHGEDQPCFGKYLSAPGTRSAGKIPGPPMQLDATVANHVSSLHELASPSRASDEFVDLHAAEAGHSGSIARDGRVEVGLVAIPFQF